MDLSNIFLITDLDHTLLTSEGEISPTDRESIHKFVSQGGHFAVATGRMQRSALQYISRLDFNMPCILYNGGMILDVHKNEILWECTLPQTALEYTREIIHTFPHIGVEIVADGVIYTPNFNEFMKIKMQVEKMDCILADFEEIPAPWMKVLFTSTEDVIPEVVEFVRGRDYTGVTFVQSSSIYYEMLPQHSSKGNALKKMRALLGIDSMKIVAVGDYNNDIEMIETADIGACVANSPDEVKKAADVVLTKTSDENALTELINHITKNLEV